MIYFISLIFALCLFTPLLSFAQFKYLVNFGILSTDWHKTLINIFKRFSFKSSGRSYKRNFHLDLQIF